jgi:hypothetical protein
MEGSLIGGVLPPEARHMGKGGEAFKATGRAVECYIVTFPDAT